jgi:F-type H+-transporting ATPase subunit a
MLPLFQSQFQIPFLLASVSPEAMPLVGFVTNSIFVGLIVTGLVFWFVKGATKNMTLVPHAKQNFAEMIIEFLYNQIETLVGKKVAPTAFPLLATLFLFILVSNWFALVPGVGTIGWGEGTGSLSLSEVETPLLRPVTADLNATLGMTLIVFATWIYLTVRETGVWGFLVHTFGPKGGLKGAMGVVMIFIFFAVGLIEVFSILLRNLTLPMRLYGNIYAGENVLHTMAAMAGEGLSAKVLTLKVLFQLPFYFMELLVGALQAMVFTLLTAVYIKLSTEHDEHAEEHH